MTLNTNGKDYIAKNFGINDCFVASGLTWTAVAVDGTTAEESGGTGSIVGRLVTTSIYKEVRLKSPRTGTFVYAQLKAANDNADVTVTDVSNVITPDDGSPIGESQYCAVFTTDLEWIRANYDTDNSCYIEESELSRAYLDYQFSKLITKEQFESVKSAHDNNTYLCTVSPTPTPTPGESTWAIGDVRDSNGTMLGAVKVYVDGIYTNHYAPEVLTFCSGCKCDPTTPCDFGVHTITIKKTGYDDWTKTRTILSGAAAVTDHPILTLSTVTPPPGPTPTPSPAERAGVFVFEGPIEGEPTVTLDLSELQMRQATDLHFEMNSIKIINTSSHPVYLAIRIHLFQGSLTYCPASGYVFDGMDKTDTRNARIKTLEVGETAYYNADFYQPTTILGAHTICMLIHGAWTRAEVQSEIVNVPG